MSIPSNAVSPNQAGTGEWENEGGSLKPHPPTPLPDGIIAVTSAHYRVGPYSYSKLDDAFAEHRRQSRRLSGFAQPHRRNF
ncbi:hypothetical protein [Altererythrobacter lutimaris]|uniref:Uncharacterized protein n=1 Tax=Altererythrobacter lutimaris TaxID=2743979 RepID=A0A850HBW1_9SPHN|nr:hypothetical protein [Altererythrobacter lutimaris]NVE94765.1 hypothetical protein [Altererythrobacter lutimaris]